MLNSTASVLYKFCFGALIALCAGAVSFVAGQVRVSPTPNPNPKFKTLQPAQTFDAAAAKKALDKGSATIKGKVCTWKSTGLLDTGQVFAAPNVKVSLFPMTAYFEEWYKLREEKEGKNTQVVMSPEAYKYRVDTETNEKSEYQFTDMKPGKYYLLTYHSFTIYTSGQVYAGTVYGSGGSADVYQNKTYANGKTKRISEIVEVTAENEIKKVNLISKGGLFQYKLVGCGR